MRGTGSPKSVFLLSATKERAAGCFALGWQVGVGGWRSQTTKHIELSPMLSCKDLMTWKQTARARPRLGLFLNKGKESVGCCVVPCLINNDSVRTDCNGTLRAWLILSHRLKDFR